jgi:hypothetical protein
MLTELFLVVALAVVARAFVPSNAPRGRVRVTVTRHMYRRD